MQLILHSIPSCATYIVTALWAGQLRNCGPFLTGSGDFLFSKAFRKVMRHETDHSHPSTGKIHNYSAQTSTPAVSFIAYTVYGKFTYTSSC
jgi:hypothetical protein